MNNETAIVNSTVTCKNCGAEFHGAYCPECSQSAGVKRVTFRDMLRDFWATVIPWNRGFLYTSRRLITAPGRTIREYLEGKRVRYTRPLSYLVVIITISVLIYSRDDFSAAFRENPAGIMEWVYKNISLMMYLMIPCMTLGSRIMFWKSGFNCVEHLVLNMYLMSISSLFDPVIKVILYFAGRSWMSTMGTVATTSVMVAYYYYAYLQFFSGIALAPRIIRTTLAILISVSLYLFIEVLWMAVIMAIENPSMK